MNSTTNILTMPAILHNRISDPNFELIEAKELDTSFPVLPPSVKPFHIWILTCANAPASLLYALLSRKAVECRGPGENTPGSSAYTVLEQFETQ